jgi:tellurite resistance protein TehA-like permease
MLVRSRVRQVDPGYFALVMATGILSIAASAGGAGTLSLVLLWIAVAGYVILVIAYGWRLAAWPREFLADAVEPTTAFAFFTFVAGSNVLGTRLAAAGYPVVTAALLAVSAAAWLALAYGVPLALVSRRADPPALVSANGTWFLWTVGTESIAVAAGSLPMPARARLAPVVIGCWAVGVVLYLLVAVLVLTRLLRYPVDPAGVTPAYWVFMGATAISVVAGATALRLPADPLLAATRPLIGGLSVVLWAFGTWLIPWLVGLGVWRHIVRKVPLRYESALWSMVFPLGMYCLASTSLGTALGVQWLATLGRDGFWAALVVWAVVLLAMLASLAGLGRAATPAGRAGT